MLVIARRPDETIQIGDHIVIRILGVNGTQVRVGIEAAKNVLISRGELLKDGCRPAT